MSLVERMVDWEKSSSRLMQGMFHHAGMEWPGDCWCEIRTDEGCVQVTAFLQVEKSIRASTRRFRDVRSTAQWENRVKSIEKWLWLVVGMWVEILNEGG